MKKFRIVMAAAALALAAAGPVMAAEGVYGSAGCGLGSVIFGDQPGGVQVFAATTNGTSANNLFGITSGTSNCNKQPKGFAHTRLGEFVAANMDTLAKEIAMGQGESLQTLIELVGIAAPERAAASAKLQANYATIFQSEGSEAPAVVEAILASLQG